MKISHISSDQDKILPSDYVVFEYTILCFAYPMSSFQAIVHSLMTPKFDSGCFNEDNVKKPDFYYNVKLVICIIYKLYLSFIFVCVVDILCC